MGRPSMHLAAGLMDNEKVHDLSLDGIGVKQVPQGVIFPVIMGPGCLEKILHQLAEGFHVSLLKAGHGVALYHKGIYL